MPKTIMPSRSRIRATCAALILSSALGMTASHPLAAQRGQVSTVVTEYAVRFICGNSQAIDREPNLSVGIYATSVAVHNPGIPVAVDRKVAIARQPTLGPGGPPATPAPPSRFQRTILGNDQAIEFTCEDIFVQAGQQPLTGFLVIHAPRELDVVAVYTAASAGRVTTFHAERVPARVVRVPFTPPDNRHSPR